MNDNKRLYNKLNTWFWWVVACFPLILLIIQMLFFAFNKNSNGLDYSMFNDFITFINNNVSSGFIYDLFDNLNDFFIYAFGLSGQIGNAISFVLAWFVFAHILHIFVDVILLLPRICQKFIERVC